MPFDAPSTTLPSAAELPPIRVCSAPLIVWMPTSLGMEMFPVTFVPTRFDETTLSCAPVEPSIRIPYDLFPETRLPAPTPPIVFPLPVTTIPWSF